jgi:hypothetical protein
LLNDSQFAGISDYNDDLSKLQYVIGLADVIPKLCYLTNYNGTEIYPVEPPETAGDKIEVKSNYFSMIIPYSYVGTDTFNCYLLSYTFNSNETDKTKFSCIPTSSKFIVSLENN